MFHNDDGNTCATISECQKKEFAEKDEIIIKDHGEKKPEDKQWH